MRHRFQQVDVFSPEPWSGNPLAVVFDAEGLTTDEMQRITQWTNLSETAFLLPPTDRRADYRVRIFTLAGELPFAGHPTLGSAHAWLAAGGSPQDSEVLVQECGAGLVDLRRTDHGLAFAAPPLRRSGPVAEDHVAVLADVLGLARDEIVDTRWVDNGPGWVAVLLESAEAVLAVSPDFTRHPGPLDIGLVGPYPPGSDCAFEVRAVFSDHQGAMREDPVTGSLNAGLAQWLVATGRATTPYVASQGTRIGRTGRPRVEQEPDGTIWVAGATVTRVDGHLIA